MSLKPTNKSVKGTWIGERLPAFVRAYLWPLYTLLAACAGAVIGWMLSGEKDIDDE